MFYPMRFRVQVLKYKSQDVPVCKRVECEEAKKRLRPANQIEQQLAGTDTK
ncbi:hypothetical protein FOQG_00443 [Fusarium oxysporum f. sp. raphani 54005]|uniref:Uncharacterized protein n=4 Tax=Fusarium oxysporum TaxID=5507 RepID=X0DAP4_FUSOX|nr:hypothetical protein FOVG_03133 [Fusarium oxysporum f. sp. pisi HDV247]EXL00170.1 hypothetical protein FOQG_00443 [Fusarium oxysporum f. sp. raphani 54005]EXL80014.1 hypothetical protein FOPG_06242 [Fusarium oxysporum f. sp. conglutinans race 2 54008]EXM36182.1 hypothetical protein FOTG_00432 [Fusarium oxysporum f. sp. vasinfectum 25433]